MYCKECGHQIADDSKFCASCGKQQNSTEVNKCWYCKKCGLKRAADNSEFCASCGKPQNSVDVNLQYILGQQNNKLSQLANVYNESQPQPKSQVIAFILCFFCGLFGFHRFYVGKIGTGVLMLLIGPFVVFGMTASDMADITGRGLSETGSTIVTISAFFAIILGIWVIVDLIRILTGSFTKVSNSNKGSGISIRAIVVLFLLLFLVFLFLFQRKEKSEVAKAQREQELQIAAERAQRTADSLIKVREDSIKKQARSSKKTPSLRLAPEQPQEVLRVRRADKDYPRKVVELE